MWNEKGPHLEVTPTPQSPPLKLTFPCVTSLLPATVAKIQPRTIRTIMVASAPARGPGGSDRIGLSVSDEISSADADAAFSSRISADGPSGGSAA